MGKFRFLSKTKFRFLTKNKIAKIPKKAGVYCFKDGKQFLYIGKATQMRERVKSHFQHPTPRNNLFIDQVKKIGYLKIGSEIEALILEASLIKKHHPKHNIIWRDNKNYFFVAKTEEDFPRIFWTHQAKKSIAHSSTQRNSKFEIEYRGPFVDGKALKQTLKILRKIFPYRSCRQLPRKPCLWYNLNRCPAPCLLKSIPEIPADSLKKVCQQNAKNLVKVITQGKNPVLRDLKHQMKRASNCRDFEVAARIRDQIVALERVIDHAKIFESSPELFPGPSWARTRKDFQNILGKKISRIEAYDVSNIAGKTATGAMVTFINGQPDKNFYRTFKLKISGKPNDIAMIKEILNRRFRHPEWPYPDLILIDGGKGQLTASLRCLKSLRGHKNLKLVALSKQNKLYLEKEKPPLNLESLPDGFKFLILQLRDEAHRFARKYHLRLREIDLFSKS